MSECQNQSLTVNMFIYARHTQTYVNQKAFEIPM